MSLAGGCALLCHVLALLYFTVITKPWAQDAISWVVYEWVFCLRGCVLHLTRCIKMAASGVVTDWSSCSVSAVLRLFASAHASSVVTVSSNQQYLALLNDKHEQIRACCDGAQMCPSGSPTGWSAAAEAGCSQSLGSLKACSRDVQGYFTACGQLRSVRLFVFKLNIEHVDLIVSHILLVALVHILFLCPLPLRRFSVQKAAWFDRSKGSNY